jgi:ribonuclease HI
MAKNLTTRPLFCKWYADHGLGDIRAGAHLPLQTLNVVLSALSKDGEPIPFKQLCDTITTYLSRRPEDLQKAVKSLEDYKAHGVGCLGKGPSNDYFLEFDGGAQPNPGLGAAGAVLRRPESAGGEIVWAGWAVPGGGTTNNQAEYAGSLIGVRTVLALEEQVVALHICGDSQLVVIQTLGKWVVRESSLRPCREKRVEAIAGFRRQGISPTWEHRVRKYIGAQMVWYDWRDCRGMNVVSVSGLPGVVTQLL